MLSCYTPLDSTPVELSRSNSTFVTDHHASTALRVSRVDALLGGVQ